MTDGQKHEFADRLAAAARERVRCLGREFSEVDFAIGAMLAIQSLTEMGVVDLPAPPGWMIGVMAGRPIWITEDQAREHREFMAERWTEWTGLRDDLKALRDQARAVVNTIARMEEELLK